MESRRRLVDAVSVEWANGKATGYVEESRRRLRRFDEDPDKAARIAKQECRYCHYMTGRIGCTAMTRQQCGVCETVGMFGSTCTDVLCKPCAERLALCKHCGADMELKNRRKPRDFTVVACQPANGG